MARRIIPTFVGGCLVLLSGAAGALAETDVPAPPSDISRPGGSLSEKLNETSGVIHPTEGVDQGMQKSPPASGTMKVVPPPGSPNGPGDVKPK